MQRNHLAIVLFVLSAVSLAQNPGGASTKRFALSALQIIDSGSDQPITPSQIAGAKVESIKLDSSGRTSTIRIRNLSDKDITAFDLVIRPAANKRADRSAAAHQLRDVLAGIQTGHMEGVHPGDSYDQVLNIGSKDVTVALDVVVYSDATAEFSDREMLMQIIAERKAVADAARQTEEIIRGSASKAEAVYKLTQLWEESKERHLPTAPLLENDLSNLRSQPDGSDVEQKLQMAEYADQRHKEAEFFSLHANLRRRTQ